MLNNIENLEVDVPKGYFGQELSVGDTIGFVASSYASSYMKIGVIDSITYAKATRYKYDHETKRSWSEPYLRPTMKIRTMHKPGRSWGHQKPYIKRIYNWRSALTPDKLPPEFGDLHVSKNG